ncbi:MAG: hypothetical protein A3F42_00230 [Gammaproteobacteria bacterium RIFCSPHIGHO2_12_FULL_37_34]|nr:MAG: hypothetical protein A3F42_00230 [Gammaproteobacteria bacterium RIFCSPHIGHO2_12_FULL_37_34]
MNRQEKTQEELDKKLIERVGIDLICLLKIQSSACTFARSYDDLEGYKLKFRCIQERSEIERYREKLNQLGLGINTFFIDALDEVSIDGYVDRGQEIRILMPITEVADKLRNYLKDHPSYDDIIDLPWLRPACR